jgi:hypothetical protein
MVAGEPLADNVLKCQLKPVTDDDFLPATFTPSEKQRLNSIFANGVCDFSKPGVGQDALMPGRARQTCLAEPKLVIRHSG